MADLSQDITAHVAGAYKTMVKLSDGAIVSLSAYWANPAGRTITAQLSGAYASRSTKSNLSLVGTVADIQATGGKDVVNEVPGAYNERVVVDGEIVPLVDKIAHDAN